MSDDENPMVENRSTLKDFLGTIATMSGDLSNITAPPFVLDTRSVIEIPSFWAENPAIFVSPAKSDDPLQRSLLVLRSFLSGLRSQCYMGHSPEHGVKKPLNAFLGELFIGKWEDENGTTHMLSEQVSHHPPITACRVWNDEYGVIAEGYNRQSVTFNGAVNVSCTGHIMKTVTKYDEHYLMPIPGFKVKNILGTPYPETDGTYYIPSTNGYTSVIHFSGKSFFSSSSKKHTFTAHLFKETEGESSPIYTIEGHWDTKFTIHDNRQKKDIEVFNVEEQVLKDKPRLNVDSIKDQDPWESKNAWKDTVAAIKKNDMKGVNDAKGRLEEGQRQMRADEEKRGEEWQPLFFTSSQNDAVLEKLNTQVPDENFEQTKSETAGIWKFKPEAWKTAKKPYHGSLRPDNTTANKAVTSDEGAKHSSKEEQLAAADTSKNNQQQPKQPQTTTNLVDRTVNESDIGRGSETKAIDRIAKDQPAPQTTQTNIAQERDGSGVSGMAVEEKHQIENMLRDQYSTASADRRASHASRNNNK